MGFLPIAHAHTVFLANQLKTKGGAKRAGLTQGQLLDKAWEVQTFSSQQDLFLDVDIERECLMAFEELLFERSSRAGVAGNCQWGLDVGEHQGGWDPYIGLPSTWNHEDRDESEGEVEVRPWPSRFSPADLRTDRVIDSPDLISWELNISKNISSLKRKKEAKNSTSGEVNIVIPFTYLDRDSEALCSISNSPGPVRCHRLETKF